MPVKVPCPTCQREVIWSEDSPWRPFCSERCRLIDLGEWLDESRRIPAEEPAEFPDLDNAPKPLPH